MSNNDGRLNGPSQAEPVVSALRASVPDVVWVFDDQVAGALAMWAIRQSPYSCPDNLDVVVRRFQELWPSGDHGMTRWDDFNAFIAEIEQVSLQIPELLAWNTPKSGYDAPMAFCSRYDQPQADDDFIDLHALWANTARTVWAEEVAAQGMSASGQDAERLEAQPASPVACDAPITPIEGTSHAD